MAEQERIQAWVDEIEELKKEAIRVWLELELKKEEYNDLMHEIAACERAIRQGRVKASG